MRTPKKTTQKENIDPNLLKKIASSVPALITVYNINTGKYSYINDTITKILGYKKEDWLKKGVGYVATLLHPDDIEELTSKNQKALEKANKKNEYAENDPIVAFEYRLRHKNGHWVWLKTDGVVFGRDLKGKVEELMNISIDITERKKREYKVVANQKEAQEELSNSRNQLETILKNIADGVTVQDLDGKLLYANTVAARSTGFKSPEELINAPIGDFFKKFEITKENGDPIPLEEFPGRRAIAGEKNPQAVFRYLNRNTLETRWSIVRASVIKRSGKSLLIINTIQDITDRKLIELEKANLAAIVESSDDAIVSKNLDGIITSWNKGAERILGYKSKEAIGKHITLIIPKELHSEEKKIIGNIKRGLRIDHFETIRVRKDGKKVNVSLSISPVMDKRGNIIGASKIARDITKRKQLEKQRDDFISIATHELKTPVTSVKAYAQALQSIFLKRNDPKSAGYLAKMDAQLNKLTDLIGDLLDVNKIQSGQLHFKPTSFDINILINEIAEELQRTTQKHKIIKKLETSKKVFADRDRIGQVLTNLISNAIKYSPNANKIIITSTTETNLIKVCVKDYGIGIPKSMLDKVFDKFFRISSPRNETFPGMGLGLHISSEFIKRQGGKIWAEGTEGEGATFCFFLPVKKIPKQNK